MKDARVDSATVWKTRPVNKIKKTPDVSENKYALGIQNDPCRDLEKFECLLSFPAGVRSHTEKLRGLQEVGVVPYSGQCCAYGWCPGYVQWHRQT